MPEGRIGRAGEPAARCQYTPKCLPLADAKTAKLQIQQSQCVCEDQTGLRLAQEQLLQRLPAPVLGRRHRPRLCLCPRPACRLGRRPARPTATRARPGPVPGALPGSRAARPGALCRALPLPGPRWPGGAVPLCRRKPGPAGAPPGGLGPRGPLGPPPLGRGPTRGGAAGPAPAALPPGGAPDGRLASGAARWSGGGGGEGLSRPAHGGRQPAGGLVGVPRRPRRAVGRPGGRPDSGRVTRPPERPPTASRSGDPGSPSPAR